MGGLSSRAHRVKSLGGSLVECIADGVNTN
jgi:hypothetical protein